MVKAAGDTDFVQNTKEIQVPQNSTMHLGKRYLGIFKYSDANQNRAKIIGERKSASQRIQFA
jgi:hypothetical protein